MVLGQFKVGQSRKTFRQVRAVQGRQRTDKIGQMCAAHTMSEQYSQLLLKYVYTIKHVVNSDE